MKITVVIESLSLKESNALYKGKTLPRYEEPYLSTVLSCTSQYQWHFLQWPVHSDKGPALFFLSFLYIEEEPPPPRSTPWGAYRSAISCGTVPPSICLQSHTFTHFTHSYLVGQSMVVGHIPMVHTLFDVHQSHRNDSTHPSVFYPVRYHSYIGEAHLGIVTYHTFRAVLVGQSPIHVLTRLMIA